MIFAVMCRDAPAADKRRTLVEKVYRRLDELGLAFDLFGGDEMNKRSTQSPRAPTCRGGPHNAQS